MSARQAPAALTSAALDAVKPARRKSAREVQAEKLAASYGLSVQKLNQILGAATALGRRFGVDQSDVLQEAHMALHVYSQKIDPAKKDSSGGYLHLCVMGCIKRSIANTSRQIRVPVEHFFETPKERLNSLTVAGSVVTDRGTDAQGIGENGVLVGQKAAVSSYFFEGLQVSDDVSALEGTPSDLTTSEASTLDAIQARGESIREAARRMKVSESTVLYHLSGISHKVTRDSARV